MLASILHPLTLIQTAGLLGVFFVIFAESGLFFGFFLPGDSLLFSAGLLASQGYFSLTLLLLGAIVSAILGDTVGYVFGKKIGPALFTWKRTIFYNKKYLEQAHDFYEKYGKKTILFARFIPIVRTFAPIVAGVTQMKYSIFSAYNAIGGIAWCSVLVLLGYFLGNTIPNVDKYIIPIVVVIILITTVPVLVRIFKK